VIPNLAIGRASTFSTSNGTRPLCSLLITEVQWEYACRAGTTSLFFFGDSLPTHRMLERFLTSDLDSASSNPFGLLGLFIGEWCREHFRSSYSSTKESSAYSIRGGGSVFWPWQGSEWGYCVSAARMPSTDWADGGRAAVRLVRELSDF
jgi:formylglycine-generating enzyme required for sulfatase activity